MPTFTISDVNMTLLYQGNWLVAVHAAGKSWQCPYSKDLLQRWEPEIAQKLQNTRIAALLEVQNYPTVKLLQQGMIWTYKESYNFTSESIVDFASDGWKYHMFYNRLPSTWSVWFKLQLDLFNMICSFMSSSERAIGTLSPSPTTNNMIVFAVFVLSTVTIGVLIPFGLVYLL
ncbi:hypothetical protein HDU79_004531 [Rhizoclosmatium sp. JEL0117]|nr:hypothetical protein HDU79_004531 [Rhizoclosmatium sp. JEL0117]